MMLKQIIQPDEELNLACAAKHSSTVHIPVWTVYC